MADRFYIQYSASATPVEQLGAADGTSSTRLVHSDIDKTIGGGVEIDCGATAADVAYIDHPTTATTTDNPIPGASIDFVMVKVREAVDDDGLISIVIVKVGGTGGSVAGYMKKVGDVILIRPNGVAGSTIIVYSVSTKLAKLDILYGREA